MPLGMGFVALTTMPILRLRPSIELGKRLAFRRSHFTGDFAIKIAAHIAKYEIDP